MEKAEEQQLEEVLQKIRSQGVGELTDHEYIIWKQGCLDQALKKCDNLNAMVASLNEIIERLETDNARLERERDEANELLRWAVTSLRPGTGVDELIRAIDKQLGITGRVTDSEPARLAAGEEG